MRLFFIIFVLSYSFGMLFRIIEESEADTLGHIVLTKCDEAGGYFNACYSMWKESTADEIIKLKYFSFTTLSTVGFGDFNPRSNPERLFIAAGMLIGIAVFSSILDNFVNMIDIIKSFEADYEEFQDLNRFISLLEKMNGGEPI